MGLFDFLSSRVTLLANTGTDGCSIGSLVGGNTTIHFGASAKVTFDRSIVTVPGAAAATLTATNVIPAGSFLLGVIVEVTASYSGPTSMTIGDGTTADLFGTGIAITAGTRTTYAGHKSTWTPVFKKTAGNVVLTGTGGSFTATGSANVEAWYLTIQ